MRISPYVYPGIKKENLPSVSKLYKRSKITPENIMKIVAESCGVTTEQILSKVRKREIVDARHIFCKILRNEFGYPYVKIGEIVNGRDHTTAIHSVTTCNDRCKTEEGYKEHYNDIVNLIFSKL